MDGELFKTEVAQRLFLWLKVQASESLSPVFVNKSLGEYTKVLGKYKVWPPEVSSEELSTLEAKAGGPEELKQVWTAVSAQWVRLTRRSESGKASVKIKTPEPMEVLKNFFLSLVTKTWCARGELWDMDPVKQDFVFREAFRQAVSESVHVIDDTVKEIKEPVVVQEPKVDKEEPKEQVKAEEPKAEEPAQEELHPEPVVKEEVVPETPVDQEVQPEETKEKPVEAENLQEEEEEEDLGPDDSVSRYFDSASVMTRQFPKQEPPPPVSAAPPRRFADAGTMIYAPPAVKKAIQPLKIQLQEPVVHLN